MSRTTALVLALALFPVACDAPGVGRDRAHAPESAVAAIVVDPSGGGDHRTIAAALAAAPRGAVVRVVAGTYAERLEIPRSVTLIGAGPDVTHLVADPGPGAARPVVAIGPNAAGPVVIEALRVTLTGEGDADSVRSGAAVVIDSSDATLRDVAVVGSPASGVVVRNGDVKLDGLLVAGCWATGVAIHQEEGAGGSIALVNSEIRNCRHRCVTIGGAATDVRVESCLVTGSDWHGIRYDGGAPTIVDNVVRDHVRSGIYASGSTRATVEGNLFVGNGLTCWFANADDIRSNTFVGADDASRFVGGRCHVAVLGAADPLVENNLFVGGPLAIHIGQIGGAGEGTASRGTARASGNVAAGVAQLVEGGELVVPDGRAAIRVVDIAEVDTVGGYPRFAGVGARSELPVASRWPERMPAERAIVALRRSEAQASTVRASATSLGGTARERAQPWIGAAMQIGDAKEREDAVDSMLAAVRSDDPVEQFAGLLAVQSTGEVSFDRAAFVAPARALARSQDGPVRVSAFYVLNLAGREEGDLAHLIEALSTEPDRELRDAGLHLLTLYANGELTGEVEAAALALLESYPEQGRIQLNGLWGARVGPQLEDWLLARHASADWQRSYDALYFGLSTLADKSPAVIDALMEAAEHPDHNRSGRAIWGLGHGVPEASQPRVATFFLDLFEARAGDRDSALRNVARYADATHVVRLEALASNELVSEPHRDAVRRAIEAIGEREE